MLGRRGFDKKMLQALRSTERKVRLDGAGGDGIGREIEGANATSREAFDDLSPGAFEPERRQRAISTGQIAHRCICGDPDARVAKRHEQHGMSASEHAEHVDHRR